MLRPPRQTVAKIFIAVGLILALASVIVWQQAARSPQAPSGSQSVPSSRQPSLREVTAYNVAPTLPKYIKIPAIELGQTRVRQLGLKNDQIAAPDNVYDAGWYNQSAKPGQPGAMFIYGHVSSWQAKGAFYNLKKLRPGDTIIIIRGDNKTFTYKVITTRIYPHDKVDMQAVLAPINGGAAGLNLMTCTGHIIKGTSEFDQRLVVFASLQT